MGLNNFVRSKGYKNFMSKLYGWGAAVVIMGALFKINHYNYANEMLIVGLTTEALIFFFSAFEPPHVEPDWSLVYPELAGMYHGSPVQKELDAKKTPTQKLDDMFKEAKIEAAIFDRLGQGLSKLSDNASKMGDISNAAVATNEFVDNVRTASKSAIELSGNYKKASDAINLDAAATTDHVNTLKSASAGAEKLTSAYNQAADILKADMRTTEEFAGTVKSATESAQSLANSYAKSAQILSKSVEALDFTAVDGDAYNQQLRKISDNLAALNAVYEIQLQGSSKSIESTEKLQKTMNEFLDKLTQSSANTAQFSSQLESLSNRMGALNKVYGNMLTAMNVNA
ncbi:MAG: gliding motility protein GldL [Bacteroidales bacterium]|nr:gliding motility protein GldL [Bacteroidales bacterium]